MGGGTGAAPSRSAQDARVQHNRGGSPSPRLVWGRESRRFFAGGRRRGRLNRSTLHGWRADGQLRRTQGLPGGSSRAANGRRVPDALRAVGQRGPGAGPRRVAATGLGSGALRTLRRRALRHRSLGRKLGDDVEHPTYIFNEPRVGYRMPRGEGAGIDGSAVIGPHNATEAG